jgi:ABC-type lipoprotein release transport system permease subunit
MTSLPFILRRARRHWQILLTLSLGVILATALLASGPLLVDTVIDMGLHLTFQSSSVTDTNLCLTTAAQVDRAGFQALDDEIRTLLRSTLDEHLDGVVWSAESAGLFPWLGDEPATDQQVNLRAYQGLEDHVEYVAGGWPAEAAGEPPGGEPGVIRAVVSDALARSLVLRVGDRLPLSLDASSVKPDAWIEVAGIVRPKDPLDPYWFGEFSPLTAQHSVLLPEDAFLAAVSSLFPGDEVDLAWHALLRHDALSTADIEPLQAQLAGLEAELGAFQPPLVLHTGVPGILARFQTQLESIRVPLYILIAEVMLLALYFVTMVAALFMRQVEREFAILRSRGTSTGQIARIQWLEALIIGAVAFLLGPWLGAGLVKALSWIGPLADLQQANWSLRPGQSAWLAAGMGALVCLAGLLLPLRPALRRSIVTHQQMVARSAHPPWWQRFYLDVFALVGGLVLLWRLRLYGEMVSAGPGGARLDWLLLLAPVVMLLGAATILLRVFPLLLRAVAALAARGPGLEGALALWQASRDPTHVTRLVLLLALAIALGNLSLGLNTTLDQSEVDRATYLAGNDLRLVSERAVPLVDLQTAPGVQQLSGVWRGQATLRFAAPEAPSGLEIVVCEPDLITDVVPSLPGLVEQEGTPASPKFEILAIEPDSFASVTTFRRDFADQKMAELLEHLVIPAGENPSLLPLPGQPAKFGLWLWGMSYDPAELDSYQRWIDGDDDAERVGLVVKLQTAQGELFTARLQRPETSGPGALQTDSLTVRMNIGGRDVSLGVHIKPDNNGWHYFEGALPALPPSSYPLSLHSLWFENQATLLGEPISIGILLVADDLQVVDAETQETLVVEDFEGPTRPLFLGIMAGQNRYVGLFTALTSEMSHSGQWGQGISMAFVCPKQTYPLRLSQTWTQEPLPALANPTFMETAALKVGDVVHAEVNSAQIDLRIVGVVRHFPTMYEQAEAGYVVTSRDLLLAVLNDTSQQSTNPNEVLIETDGRTSLDSLSSLVPALSQSWQAESVRQALKANPLALALRAATFFGAALMILLSLVGFAAHFYLSIRQQEMLYGVMRALGLSPRQLYRWIVVEQAVLILAGLVLGTLLGLLLNQVTLPRLPVSLGEQQPIPPFVSRTDWLALGGLYLFLAVALLAMLGVVTALLRRARIHRILRIGQE